MVFTFQIAKGDMHECVVKASEKIAHKNEEDTTNYRSSH